MIKEFWEKIRYGVTCAKRVCVCEFRAVCRSHEIMMQAYNKWNQGNKQKYHRQSAEAEFGIASNEAGHQKWQNRWVSCVRRPHRIIINICFVLRWRQKRRRSRWRQTFERVESGKFTLCLLEWRTFLSAYRPRKKRVPHIRTKMVATDLSMCIYQRAMAIVWINGTQAEKEQFCRETKREEESKWRGQNKS